MYENNQDNLTNNQQVLAHITGQHDVVVPASPPNTDTYSYHELDLPEELVSETKSYTEETSEQDFTKLAFELQEAQEIAAKQFAQMEEKREQRTLTLEDLIKDEQRVLPFTFSCESQPLTVELCCLLPTVSQNFKLVSGYNMYIGGYTKLVNKKYELAKLEERITEEDAISELAIVSCEIAQYIEKNFHCLKPAFDLLCRATGEKLSEKQLNNLLARLNPSDYFSLATSIMQTVQGGKLTK